MTERGYKVAAPKPTHITRAPKDKDNPYFMYRRDTAQDESLSWAARGILAYLLSKPDDWIVRVKDLQQGCKSQKVYSILDELEQAHYLTREEKQSHGEKGQFGPWIYHIHEIPHVEKAYAAQPHTEKPPLTYKRESQNTESTEKTYANTAPIGSKKSSIDKIGSDPIGHAGSPGQVAQSGIIFDPLPSQSGNEPGSVKPDRTSQTTESPKENSAKESPPLPLPLQYLRNALPDEGASDLDHLTALFGLQRIARNANYAAGEQVPFVIGALRVQILEAISPKEARERVERVRRELELYESPPDKKAAGDVVSIPSSEASPVPSKEPELSEESSKSTAPGNGSGVLPQPPPQGFEWRGIDGVRHLVKADLKTPKPALVCGAEYDGLVVTGPAFNNFVPCGLCLRKVEERQSTHHKPTAYDPVFDALVAGLSRQSGASNHAKAAWGSCAGEILHGCKKNKKKTEQCEGLLAYERLRLNTEELDFPALALLVTRFWSLHETDWRPDWPGCKWFMGKWDLFPKDGNGEETGNRNGVTSRPGVAGVFSETGQATSPAGADATGSNGLSAEGRRVLAASNNRLVAEAIAERFGRKMPGV